MTNTLSVQQKAALSRLDRFAGGFPYGSGASSGFAQFIADILTAMSATEVGILSNAYDVDSLALGGGAFSVNANTIAGLTFGYYQGSFYNGASGGIVQVAAGTVLCT